MQHRPLDIIAADIRANWRNVHGEAEQALAAMATLKDVSQRYGGDSGMEVVSRLRWALRTWKGPAARRVKAEMDAIIKGK